MAAEPPAKLDFKSRRLVNQIVEHVKSQGIFDQFRRDCIEELEQKESYRQLKQRVESHVATFLSKQTWTDGLPKNQVRDSLRKHINQSDVLDRGVKQLISQALESKAKAFQTRIEGVVQNYIYMQKHPQNQGKPARKLRMVDSKEETKPSTSEVISDISQLIPIPCSASTGSKTSDSFGVEKGKSVTQEGSKSGASSRGVQQGKKSHSTQGKTSLTPGKGEEIKSGTSSVREKEVPEESVRAKDRKTKASRTKKESLSRDDYSQLSPKPDENLHKVKDEKTKISRVKIENSNPSGGSPSSVGTDSSSLIPQDERINSRKGMRENVSQSQLLAAGEDGFSKSDVARLSQVKIEKANESDSHACSFLESKVKEKEQRSRIPGVKIESSESTVIQQQQKEVLGSELKLTGDPPKEHDRCVLHGGISKIDAGVQRSDNFVEATRPEETSERVVEKRDADVLVILNENKVKELEGGETAGKLERKVENTREEKRDLRTDSCLKIRSALDPSRVKDAETLASKTGEELSSNKKEEVIEQTRLKDESQRQKLSDERGHPPTQKEDTVRAESVSETMGLESSFMGGENVGHASSTGEYSDGESDISEVSSVHTSDLSSFDEEISSSSESYNDEDENARACEMETYKGDKNEDQESYSAQPQGKQDSDAAPTRRSTRISSRRSTKEGESEMSEGEEGKTKTGSPRRRRRDEKTERRTRREAVKGQSKSDAKKRGRGRPRKDERHASSHSGSQMRRSRARDQEGSRSREERTKRSQRPIKRTRCYSPSSEGTREVFLPRKRSRDDPV